jgi:hypothetical protein
MNLLTRAEMKFGRFAIPSLLRFILGITIAVFILQKLYPHTIAFWELDPERIKQGEVWRLISYIFIPRFGSIFGENVGMLFYVMFQVWVGDALEQVWGAFRLNVYFFLGMIGTTIAAFIYGAHLSNILLMNSLFFAFARYFGDLVINIFFILPVKVKWLAWFDAALLILGFLLGGTETRISILLSLSNFFIFFGKDIFRDARLHHMAHHRRLKFHADMRAGADETMHRCSVCGCTEISHPDQHFRVNGEGEEYCLEHLPARPAK